VDLGPALERVRGGGTLERGEARALVGALLDREYDAGDLAEFLRALATRGETEDEICGAAEALRARMVVFEHAHADAIDTCGTGGDGLGTFNVSTAAAIVAAGAGARVVKHGNKSQSGRTGSADLVEALGIPLAPGHDALRASLERAGIAYVHAPAAHPLVARVAPVRRALGIRTLFNFLGPLCNPGRVRRQLLGVCEVARVPALARALADLGHERAYVVHGAGGADELMPGRANVVRAVGLVPAWDGAAERAFAPAAATALAGGDAPANAALVRRVLAGERGAPRDAVVLNAGAALVVAGVADSALEGAARAAEAIDRGTARRALELWQSSARGAA
jgi:anthranilate phosphoribosyltransferase